MRYNSFQNSSRHSQIFVLILLLIITILIPSASIHRASADAVVDDLKSKISARNSTIQDLQRQIDALDKQITETGTQADSLKNTIAELDLTKKKLETNIKLTQAKIASANLEIERLQLDIDSKQNNIEDNKTIIAQSLNKIFQSGHSSIIETILSQESLASSLNTMDNLSFVQAGVNRRIGELLSAKRIVETNKSATESEKMKLVDLNNELNSERKIVAQTTAAKNALLAQTKNTEASYKKALAAKAAQKTAFEREVADLEASLRIAIDPASIPPVGTGVLKWPLTKIVITQYFGNTPFATKNPQIYSGAGHTGVDFGASIGTPVRASLDGTVVGVANTDLISTCSSFGKWIMIKHPNGLSTLYAHLSLQNVSVGSVVTTGQIIGYSGNTGYSTGPHLHFGVYATEGVRITTLSPSQSVNCRGATLPLADPKAYLNPLSFL